jgi:small-conductance mechanosensitive channel
LRRTTRSATIAVPENQRMQDVVTWLPFGDQLLDAVTWLEANATELSTATIGQAAVVALAYIVAWLVSPLIRRTVAALVKGRWIESYAPVLGRVLSPLTLPAIWLVLMWVGLGIAQQLRQPAGVINLAATLATAWVVIRLSTSFVRNTALSNVLAALVWTIAALNILGLLTPAMDLFDSVAITAGTLRISLLTLIKALLWLGGGIWLASLAGGVLEKRIFSARALTPSMQVLITKLAKIALVVTAAIVTLGAIGIDLTALTVLTGALGLGVGFGLQKAVANFVSGLSMLLDKSIKPGDVISVGETFGWVHTMGGRYVSIQTRDGLEHLIPNEDLISKEVVNWSLSDNRVRIRTPIGVSYKSDVRKAREICVEAARDTTRVLKHPAPLCHLVEFGDNSVNLELRFWINDPRNGVVNVKSEVLLKIWDRFKAEGVEIPFPQRDLHVTSPVQVTLTPRQPE